MTMRPEAFLGHPVVGLASVARVLGLQEERGGQAAVVVGREPVSLCGRPCDSPGWAVSPNPYLSFVPRVFRPMEIEQRRRR